MDRTRLFTGVFRRLFVYNIVFEDSEIDQQILELDERAVVLSITGAGCGVASMVAKGPRRIDAVDINHHHLALTAVKVEAARTLRSYAEFYDMFARGYTTDPRRMLQRLTQDLSPWIGRYWALRAARFHQPYYAQGICGRMLTMLRRTCGLSADWLRSLITMPLAERISQVERTFDSALNKPHVKAFLHSPLHDVGAGINRAQRERMLATAMTDLVGFYVEHGKRVAQTDLERNWIAWYAIAGHFNHDHPEALPPYLRRAWHQRSLEQRRIPVHYHCDNLLRVLGRAGARQWSHYVLSDAPDWMPDPMQRHMLEEVHRTARPGALVLKRSVEREDMIERHGLTHRFERLAAPSDYASANDRSRQYHRIDLYRVVA